MSNRLLNTFVLIPPTTVGGALPDFQGSLSISDIDFADKITIRVVISSSVSSDINLYRNFYYLPTPSLSGPSLGQTEYLGNFLGDFTYTFSIPYRTSDIPDSIDIQGVVTSGLAVVYMEAAVWG